jgi:hypothetical protein
MARRPGDPIAAGASFGLSPAALGGIYLFASLLSAATLLRLTGQRLMAHAEAAATARHFGTGGDKSWR